MNQKMILIISSMLVLSLTLSACDISITINPTVEPVSTNAPLPAPTKKPTNTPEPPATNTISPTDEPIHDIYAGFTGDQEMPFIILHRSGEKLGVTQEDGVVWNSPTGESIVIFLGGNRLPKSAVVGKFVIHYSNYTASTVDITIISPDGKRDVIRTTYSAELSKRIYAHFNPSYHQIKYSLPNSMGPQQQSIWDKIDNAMFDIDVATCSLKSYAAVNLAASEFLPTIYEACAGAFIDLKIKEGKAQNMDVTNLEGIKVIYDTLRCNGVILAAVPDPKSCLSVIITAMKTLRVQAVYADDNLPPAQPVAGPTPSCKGKYSCP